MYRSWREEFDLPFTVERWLSVRQVDVFLCIHLWVLAPA
jgi:hypothetical protein